MHYEIVGDSRDRPEWLRMRQKSLGASDTPAVLGLSRYDSPLSIYASKVLVADAADEDQTAQARIGREIEPFVLKMISEDLGCVGWSHEHALLRSLEYPWLSCTMDGKLLFPGDWNWCEIKVQGNPDEWRNGVPMEVFPQIQQQMLVTGAEEMYVGLFFVGFAASLGNCKVTRDEDFLQDVLIPETRKFWDDHVLPEREMGIEIDGAEATIKALERLHPIETKETEVFCDEDAFMEYADELVALNEEIKLADGKKRKIQNEIRSKLGDKAQLVLADGRYFSWKKQKGGTYSRKDSRVLRGPYGGVK